MSDNENPFIKTVYRLNGTEDKVENVHLPNDKHYLKSSKRQAVYKSYAKTFGLDVSVLTLPDGSIDESATVIEPEETLHVFTKEHPRPANALKDGEAILDRFRELGTGEPFGGT